MANEITLTLKYTGNFLKSNLISLLVLRIFPGSICLKDASTHCKTSI